MAEADRVLAVEAFEKGCNTHVATLQRILSLRSQNAFAHMVLLIHLL